MIPFIIKEVIYIAFDFKAGRATNLSPWSCIVAMVALIFRKPNSLITVYYQFVIYFKHRFQGDKQKSVEAIIHQKE